MFLKPNKNGWFWCYCALLLRLFDDALLHCGHKSGCVCVCFLSADDNSETAAIIRKERKEKSCCNACRNDNQVEERWECTGTDDLSLLNAFFFSFLFCCLLFFLFFENLLSFYVLLCVTAASLFSLYMYVYTVELKRIGIFYLILSISLSYFDFGIFFVRDFLHF